MTKLPLKSLPILKTRPYRHTVHLTAFLNADKQLSIIDFALRQRSALGNTSPSAASLENRKRLIKEREAALRAHYTALAAMDAAAARPREATAEEQTAIWQAVRANDKNALRKILANSISVDFRDSSQKTPLIVAAYDGHKEIVEMLLANGADPNVHDDDRYTALILAKKNGHSACVELLEAAEKKLNPTPNKKWGRLGL